MMIEIEKPELEALILERMELGEFRTVEDALLQALKSSPLPSRPSAAGSNKKPERTGAELVAAMQAMPYRDIDIEPSRIADRKSLAQLFAESPFRGTDMEFERDPSPLRPVEF